jgi:hypothetical protein
VRIALLCHFCNRGKTPGGASFSAWHETPKYDSMAV